MVRSYYYDGNQYTPRSQNEATKGFILSSIASGALLRASWLLNRPFEAQIKKEHSQNYLYKDAFFKSYEISGLKNKNCKIELAQFESGTAESKGLNAFYENLSRIIKLNTEKASILGFHEMGHAMNDLMSKSGKLLQKMRYPGYAIAGLMEYYAIFSRTKPKGAPRNLTDIIEDNCGKFAFFAMLPVVAEEAIASSKGIQLAKKAGLSEPLIKNMKKLYGKALLTYASRAVFGGVAVALSRFIMDKYTRPKIVEEEILPIDIF